MIVLDENLDEERVLKPLAARYKGTTLSVRELRPGSVIKDDAIPIVLRQQKRPTFLTTNVVDFWQKIPAHPSYCIVCFPLSTERQDEIPDLFISFLRHRNFRTIAMRMGKVIRLTRRGIGWYQFPDQSIHKLDW